MKKRPTIGVITAECYREFRAEMICGIIAQGQLAGCNVIVLAARNNFQAPVSAHVEHEADLFRLIGSPDFPTALTALSMTRFPLCKAAFKRCWMIS